MDGWIGVGSVDVRSISSSRSGRCERPLRKLSDACWRSSSSWADWMALVFLGVPSLFVSDFFHMYVGR